ncbi:hypothetical protein [Haloarcula sp. CGMCC 1.6347]|uniref:hypothetical protein n=1 Tax=Haloarcula sp. CGMCC 1.6347 TaxID=3111455 RepID=UPI00300ECAF9
MTPEVSTHMDLTQLSDFNQSGPEIPGLPAAEVVKLDILGERDNQTDTWDRALGVEADDVAPGSRDGLFFVEDWTCILVTTESGEWFGWCEEQTKESACEHLCGLAQLDVIDDIELPEVRFA